MCSFSSPLEQALKESTVMLILALRKWRPNCSQLEGALLYDFESTWIALKKKVRSSWKQSIYTRFKIHFSSGLFRRTSSRLTCMFRAVNRSLVVLVCRGLSSVIAQDNNKDIRNAFQLWRLRSEDRFGRVKKPLSIGGLLLDKGWRFLEEGRYR